MKKTLSFFIVVLCLFVLSSCYLPEEASAILGGGDDEITVTFVIDGVETTKTFDGNIEYPELPEKKNYKFSGWYYDDTGRTPAYLGTTSNSSVTLYAHWTFDYDAALDSIFSEEIKATVGIRVDHKKGGFFNSATNKVTGSGIIYKEDADFYYILSNNHVTAEMEGYSSRTIMVTDCYGIDHEAIFVAADPSCDLSIIKILKTQTPLLALDLADNASELGNLVIAIGQPNGIDNSVTFGKMVKFDTISGDDPDANLTFPVIWHDAMTDHGSSGGVLLNDKFEIIGINYAVGTSKEDNSFICGFAVPLDKVKNFISRY